jgi:hypothetical protein
MNSSLKKGAKSIYADRRGRRPGKSREPRDAVLQSRAGCGIRSACGAPSECVQESRVRRRLSFRRRRRTAPSARTRPCAPTEKSTFCCWWPVAPPRHWPCPAVSYPRMKRGLPRLLSSNSEGRFLGPATSSVKAAYGVAGPRNDTLGSPVRMHGIGFLNTLSESCPPRSSRRAAASSAAVRHLSTATIAACTSSSARSRTARPPPSGARSAWSGGKRPGPVHPIIIDAGDPRGMRFWPPARPPASEP